MAATTANPGQGEDKGVGQPKKGERYHCAECGMGLEITADCTCDASCPVHFHCCAQEMVEA
jgi:hypothetical protein